MITEPGTVARVSADFIWVRCEAQQACQRCAEGRGCGGGLLGRLLGDRLRLVRVPRADLDLQVGEGVVVALGESAVVRAAVVMYLVPLLTLFLGAVALHGLAGGGDLWAIAGGIAGLVVGLAYARRFGLRHAADPRYQPAVLGRVEITGGDVCPAATLATR